MNRRTGTAALLLCTLLAVASLLPPAARADDTWHDGWCEQGEGLTLVLDWGASGDHSPTIPGNQTGTLLVRCILIGPDGQFPVEVLHDDIGSILASAGVPYTRTGITSVINGIEATGDQASPEGTRYWHQTAGTEGAWGSGWIVNMPYVDTFQGMTLYEIGSEDDTAPRVTPKFAPPKASPSPSPSATPSGDGSTPSGGPTGGTRPTEDTTQTPTPGPSGLGTPTQTAAPATRTPTTGTPAPPVASPTDSGRPTRPSPARSTSASASAPTPSRSASVTPTPSPEQASPSPQAPTSQPVAPTAPPTIWGNENAQRTDGEQQQASVAGGGMQAVTIIALLALVAAPGVTIARGRRAAQQPQIDDE